MYMYYNGDKYQGEWVDDEKNGNGEYHYHSSSELYKGQWRNNKKNGHGEYIFSNGDRFIG